jgi:formylglycine-generating enzyme required for sulfatase activity
MGKYQVTQAQWRQIANRTELKENRDLTPDPSEFKGDNRPVECVSWEDVVEFCDRLSKYTKRLYRLPSEAEWEYACRAGTTTPFHFGETITTDLANYDGNYVYGNGVKGTYRKETTEVGSFGVANNFGLYDMHGNVWEWCQDNWHDNYEGAPTDGSAWINNEEHNNKKLLRGGSWFYNPDYCRSAYRGSNYLDDINHNIGFRVVCSGAARTQ